MHGCFSFTVVWMPLLYCFVVYICCFVMHSYVIPVVLPMYFVLIHCLGCSTGVSCTFPVVFYWCTFYFIFLHNKEKTFSKIKLAIKNPLHTQSQSILSVIGTTYPTYNPRSNREGAAGLWAQHVLSVWSPSLDLAPRGLCPLVATLRVQFDHVHQITSRRAVPSQPIWNNGGDK